MGAFDKLKSRLPSCSLASFGRAGKTAYSRRKIALLQYVMQLIDFVGASLARDNSKNFSVKVEGVSKKFCRSLKRSLWYGVPDVASEMLGREGHHEELRKNEFWAVNDVSFELRCGECLGLIGPNGAGKKHPAEDAERPGQAG